MERKNRFWQITSSLWHSLHGILFFTLIIRKQYSLEQGDGRLRRNVSKGKKKQNKTDYVTCLTALRDVSQTPHSFLSESLGVNQSMIHLPNKQTKQMGDCGFISVSQMSLLKLNFRTGQLSPHVTKDWGNHAHCMFIPKGKKGRGEPSSRSYSSQIHQPDKSLCLPRNGVS